MTSRYKMWQCLEADRLGSTLALDYQALKTKKRLAARRAAKNTIRSAMMANKPWISNSGDEIWQKRPVQAREKVDGDIQYHSESDASEYPEEQSLCG